MYFHDKYKSVIGHSLEYMYSGFLFTCVSGSSEPMLVAPSLTTSVSWVIVLAEEWAAWASFSWLDAAPATSSLVSSTSALAVFKMLSLRDGTHCVTICSTVTLKHKQYERKLLLLRWTKCLFSTDNNVFTFNVWNACQYVALLINYHSPKWVIQSKHELCSTDSTRKT